jgi:hypothetical protein
VGFQGTHTVAHCSPFHNQLRNQVELEVVSYLFALSASGLRKLLAKSAKSAVVGGKSLIDLGRKELPKTRLTKLALATRTRKSGPSLPLHCGKSATTATIDKDKETPWRRSNKHKSAIRMTVFCLKNLSVAMNKLPISHPATKKIYSIHLQVHSDSLGTSTQMRALNKKLHKKTHSLLILRRGTGIK